MKSMSSITGRLVSGVLLTSLIAGVSSLAVAKDVTLRMANWVPIKHHLPAGTLPPWIAEIKKASGGSINIVIDKAPIAKPPAQYDIVRKGAADLAYHVMAYTPGPFEIVRGVELPFIAPNAEVVPELETYMDALRKDGDSVGARIEVVATGVPVGWGEPLFDRLDADIAHAMMGLNAVKGVEIGAGFHAVSQRGSEHGDELTPEGFVGNNAGGILGGISTGQDISVSLAIKPTSSIRTPRRSIDKAGDPAVVETFGRHDPCVGIRATPIAEALLALVLIDHALRHRAQCGDVSVETPAIAAKAS